MKSNSFILFFLSLIILSQCNNKKKTINDINTIYNNKEIIIEEFSNTGLLRRSQLVIVQYCYNDSINEFFFLYDFDDSVYSYIRSEITFPIQKIKVLKDIDSNDSTQIANTLIQDIKRILHIFNIYGIQEINKRLVPLGINFSVILSNGRMLYIPNTNREYVMKYIIDSESYIKIDKNWYYQIYD